MAACVSSSSFTGGTIMLQQQQQQQRAGLCSAQVAHLAALLMQELSGALQEQPLHSSTDGITDGSTDGSAAAVDALLGQFAAEGPGGGHLTECQQLIDDCYGPALTYKQQGQTSAEALQLLHQRLLQVGALRWARAPFPDAAEARNHVV